MFPWWTVMPMFYPMLPNDCDLPPTIYSLLDAIVNYNSEEETPIKDLAKNGRSEIFDFEYPLTSNISKEDFESLILNHYMMRRIGYETLTAFKLALNVKLNSIMPIYNKMFDSLNAWNLFADGEVTTRNTTDESSSELLTNNTGDTRYSDTPQGRLSDIANGTYMTDYTSTSNDSASTGSASDEVNETITRTQHDKIGIYKEFQKEIKSIYQLIFDELDDLFYSLT